MLHLIKLAVGARAAEDIATWQAGRAGTARTATVPTRQFPKRAAELAEGGSLFWVVAGVTGVRQPIVAVRETTRADGTRGTLIEVERTLIAVAPRRVRAFQGWRYLTPADAPVDQADIDGVDAGALPGQLRRALAELCLI